MDSLTLSVPVTVPSPERIEKMWREELRRVAGDRRGWVTFAEAAEYIGVAKRTFERKKKSLGIPVSEHGGVKRIFIRDLDALMAASTTTPKNPIIQFPSQLLKQAAPSSGICAA